MKYSRFKIIYCCYVFTANFIQDSSLLKLTERQKINLKKTYMYNQNNSSVGECRWVAVEGGEIVKEEEWDDDEEDKDEHLKETFLQP